MKKSEFQKFEDFKKRHNLTNKEIVKIMSDYALTSDEFSCSFFCAKYTLSPYVFYKIRDYVIIFMLVSRNMCKHIRAKSIRNQIGNNPTGNYNSSSAHYKNLLAKRREYLDSFSNVEIVQIAIMYANDYSLYEIAKKHEISTETVRNLIASSLVNRLVDEETYHKIKLRSDHFRFMHLRGNNIFSAESLWNSYKKQQGKPNS